VLRASWARHSFCFLFLSHLGLFFLSIRVIGSNLAIFLALKLGGRFAFLLGPLGKNEVRRWDG